MPTIGLTDTEELQLITLLGKIPQGNFSLNLFRAIARIVRLTSVEVLIYQFNRNTNQQEILMAKVPETDPFYPGHWAAPGTMLMDTDDTIELAFERILKKIEVSKFSQQPIFVGPPLIRRENRGPEIHLVHSASINEEPSNSKFYSIHKLPYPLVACEQPMIEMTAHRQIHFKDRS